MKLKEFKGFRSFGNGIIPDATIIARITIDRTGATLSLSDDENAMFGIDLDQLERWIATVRKNRRAKK